MTVTLLEKEKRACAQAEKPFLYTEYTVRVEANDRIYTFYVHRHGKTGRFHVYDRNDNDCFVRPTGWSNTLVKAFEKARNKIACYRVEYERRFGIPEEDIHSINELIRE